MRSSVPTFRSFVFCLSILALGGCGNGNGTGNASEDGGGDLGNHDVGAIPDSGNDDTRFDRDTPEECTTLGCICTEDDDCASGYCLQVGGSGNRVCSELCVDECSEDGFDCRLLENSGGEAVRLCVPEDDPYCQPCNTPSDCGSLRALCMPLDNAESACLTPCDEEEATCPSGAECRLVEHQDVAGRFCVPTGGVCEPCIDEDEDGRGIGAECLGGDPDDTDPTVYDGAPELCDGLDNDGDLDVDEGFDLSSDVDNCGECGIVCEAPNAITACEDGICRIDECEEDWADCDTVYDNGCEHDLSTGFTCEDLLVPPAVEITAPAPDAIVDAALDVVLTGVVSDTTDAAETLLVVWESDVDGVLFEGSADPDGLTEWTGMLAPGAHVITLSATDSDDRVGDASITIRANRAPDAPEIEILPDPALTTDELSVNRVSADTDEDGETLTFTYEWQRNDEVVDELGASTVSADETAFDDRWAVTIVAHDEISSSAPATAEIVISNSVPSIEVVTIDPSVPHVGAMLDCSYDGYADADEHEDLSEIRWFVGDAEVGAGTEWTVEGVERGDDVRCEVSPFDGHDYGEPISATVRVGNAAPDAVDVHIAPDDPIHTSTLECEYTFDDADEDDDESTVRWFVDDELVGVGPTLVDAFARGSGVYCEVTPFDGSLSGEAVASPRITIGNALPEALTAVIDPNPAFEGSELECLATGEDIDGDEPSFVIRWSVDDVWIDPPTDTIDGDDFDEGSRVRCEATPVDGAVPEDRGEPLLSDELIIANTPPSVGSVWITPDPAATLETLTCVYDGFADVDGDDDHSELSFWVGEELIVEGSELVDGGFRGQVIRCRVIPHDGDDPGEPVWSEPLTIGNAPPSLESLALEPDPLTAASAITCDAGWASDPETDAVTITYTWTVNGDPVGPFDPPEVLPTTWFERGDDIECTATPNDGDLDGETLEATGNVVNAPPRIVSVEIDPSLAFTDTTVRAVVTVADADEDPVLVELDWTVAGIIVADTPALDGNIWFDRDQVIGLRATPSDDDGAGAAVFAIPVTVQNTPPEAPTISITPEIPVEGDVPIVCSVDAESFDLDGDESTYSITWQVGDEDFVGAETSTLPGDTIPADALLPDEVWTCTVTPHDGTDPGTPASTSVTVSRAVTRVFVTNETTSSNIGGLEGADEFCNLAADAAGLTGAWTALISTTGSNARDRISEGPYERLDGVEIAVDRDDLFDGGIAAPINVNEYGDSATRNVYTGSDTDGTRGTNSWGNGLCKNWTQGCGVCEGNHWYAQSGLSGESGSRWIAWGWQFCGGGSSLYCFEDVPGR